MSLSNVLSFGPKLAWKNPKILIPALLVFFLFPLTYFILSNILPPVQTNFAGFNLAYTLLLTNLIFSIIIFLLTPLIIGGYYEIERQVVNGKPVNLTKAFKEARRKYFTLFKNSFLIMCWLLAVFIAAQMLASWESFFVLHGYSPLIGVLYANFYPISLTFAISLFLDVTLPFFFWQAAFTVVSENKGFLESAKTSLETSIKNFKNFKKTTFALVFLLAAFFITYLSFTAFIMSVFALSDTALLLLMFAQALLETLFISWLALTSTAFYYEHVKKKI